MSLVTRCTACKEPRCDTLPLTETVNDEGRMCFAERCPCGGDLVIGLDAESEARWIEERDSLERLLLGTPEEP